MKQEGSLGSEAEDTVRKIGTPALTQSKMGIAGVFCDLTHILKGLLLSVDSEELEHPAISQVK